MSTAVAEATQEVSFPVTGMTCASCVRRIEKALTRVEGVHEASVNLATEKARVVYEPHVATFGTLSAAVHKAGYGVGEVSAEAPTPGQAEPVDEQASQSQRDIDDLKRRWMVALPVGVGMMALMYIPLPLDAMDILMPALLVIATIVQFWAGRGFYAAAWAAARHG